jgi:hypothetical protein
VKHIQPRAIHQHNFDAIRDRNILLLADKEDAAGKDSPAPSVQLILLPRSAKPSRQLRFEFLKFFDAEGTVSVSIDLTEYFLSG